MSYSATRRKRFTAGVLAGAMAMTVMPILGLTGTAGALEPATGDGSVCEDAPDQEPFADINGATDEGEDDPSLAEIECLVSTGITVGLDTEPPTYGPNNSVTRRQMALFLERVGDTAEANEVDEEITALPEGDGETTFTDIADEPAEIRDAIDRLSDADVAQGVTTTEFVPGANVTRRQMAKFIVRLEEYLTGEALEAPAEDFFSDDNGDSGEEELNILAAQGIFLGTSSDNDEVDPGGDITRRQMANVIVRTLQWLFENGDITRLFAEDDTNQTFAVTPAEEAVNDVSASNVSNTGRREYSVSGLAAGAYDIALVPAENVTDTAGTVSFSSVATVADNSGPSIEIVNGAVQTAAGSGNETEQVNNVSPTDGTITFTIDSDVADEVIPVIWLDAEATGDNTLDLNADGTPSESFAIGGQKNWVPAEALATDTGGTATAVNRNLDYFVAGGDTYFYDDNDAYALSAAPLTMAQFEGLLTVGDVIAAQYNPDDAEQSVFNVTTDVVPAPASVTATVSDTDSDGASDDVTVTWTPSAQADAVYDVYRATDGTCDATDTQVADNQADTSLTDTSVAATPTPVIYCVRAVGAVSGATSGTTSAAAVTVPPTPDTIEPETVANGVVADVDTATDGAADTGDVWVLTFDEDVTVTSDATLDVSDGTDSVLVENGVNSTWVADGQTVTVTLTAPLTGPAALNYPLSIVFGAGVVDAAGNDWTDGGGGADLSIEDDGPEFMTGGGTSVVASGTSIQLAFNEAVLAGSVEADCSDFTVAGAGTCTVATVSADGMTVTLTGTGFVGGTTTVAIAGAITDTEGQTTPTQAATVIPAA